MNTDNLLRVLILEDEPDDATLILYHVKKTMYKINARIISDEKQYNALLKSWEPDIIISDYYIPGFDGADALKQAKKLAPETPFIFVTGKVSEELAEETIISSTEAYLLKDHLERLPQIIEVLIDNQKLFIKNKNLKAMMSDAHALIKSSKEKVSKKRPDISKFKPK